METINKKQEELKSELSEQDMQQLKGGMSDNTPISKDPDDQDVDRGTDNCCNSW